MSRTRSQDRFVAGARIGNYRVTRELGATTTSATYEAAHVVLPRVALIKVMHPQTASIQAFAIQMLREACILEALRHAGVPCVYESGVLADKRPWFAVERVDGEPLIARLADGLLAPVEVAAVVRDVATVLVHAHRRGVVHANLGPERIVMTGGERGFPVCVIDWGDARPYDATDVMTKPYAGVRSFVAPEIARGDLIDDRADVFALGALAYLAMTGERPLVDDVGAPYQPIGERCPHAPRELCAVIDQMLARDRFDRPSSAEVHAALAWVERAPARHETERDVTVDDVDLVDFDDVPASTAALRIRKPRWTPPFVGEGANSTGSVDDEASEPELLPE